MIRLSRILCLFGLILAVSSTFAQREEMPIKIFGYFQTTFQHWTAQADHQEFNSFSLQQLNLFFQKDITRSWSAFVNFEFLNNFSSIRQWGSANLEEAWVKYRLNEKFSLKLGLQIPIFNNLNTIKNRTPLLPYIIRPIAYETSFTEFIPIEEFVPHRAFVQAYGFFPSGEVKFEYAAYLGNSPNINDDRERGQTGVDTMSAVLVGGRLGIRYQELKFGISATRENRSDFIGSEPLFAIATFRFDNILSVRLGGDLSYNVANFSLESEFINVDVSSDIVELGTDLDFYYATLGYNFTDRFFLYGSYWTIKSRAEYLVPENGFINTEEITVPNAGISFNLYDRIRIKGQFAHVSDEYIERDGSGNSRLEKKVSFNIYALAVSVFF